MSVTTKKGLQYYLKVPTMDNPDIEFSLAEIDGAIESLSLIPEIEDAVKKAAKKALVKNWNDNNPEADRIPEEEVKFLLQQINEE